MYSVGLFSQRLSSLIYYLHARTCVSPWNRHYFRSLKMGRQSGATFILHDAKCTLWCCSRLGVRVLGCSILWDLSCRWCLFFCSFSRIRFMSCSGSSRGGSRLDSEWRCVYLVRLGFKGSELGHIVIIQL